MKRYGFILKILSVVLSVALVLSIFPITISASTDEHLNAVTVTVIDEDDNPISGAQVSFTIDSATNGDGFESGIVTTDDSGTVEIISSDSFVADDMTLNATITIEGYESNAISQLISDVNQDFKVVLKAEETIKVTATNSEYTGKEMDAVSVSGTNAGDVVTYKLGDGEFSNEIPKVKDEGTYKVTVKVIRNGKIVFEKEVEAVITASTDILIVGGYSATAYSGIYNGVANKAIDVTATNALDNDIVEYKLGDGEFSSKVPMITNAGTYKVTVRITREGYEPKEIELEATISAAEQELEFASELYYDGGTLSIEFEGSSATYDFSVKDADDSISYGVKVLQGTNATITDEGVLVVSGTGCYEVKATKSASANYNAKSIIFTLVVTRTDDQLISFSQNAVEYIFGMNDGVIADQTTTKKYPTDTDEVEYKITEGYGVAVDKDGKVTIKDYNKLSEKLETEDEVKIVVTATKPEHKTYVSTNTKPHNKNTNTVYFSDNKNWGTVYVHYWGGASQTQWPGVAMISVDENHLGEPLYKYDIPKDCTNVVFNNNNNGEQTIDIVEVSDNTGYYLTNKTSDKWGVRSYKAQYDDYTPGAVETVYKKAEASYVITIKTIDTLENAYTVESKPNEQGWYNQGVEITPAEGYKIALCAGDEFCDRVPISEEGIHERFIYLQSQVEDTKGAITKKISVGELKIDTTAPDLNENMEIKYRHKTTDILLEILTLGFYDSGVVVDLTIDDENGEIESGLKEIKWQFTDKNGIFDEGTIAITEKNLVDGKYKAKLELNASQAKQYRGKITFSATDIAGNTSTDSPDEELEKPEIVLDNIPPVGGVTYSKPVEDIYYFDKIEATIKIIEANFFEEDVEVTVTKDDKSYDVKVNWTDGENTDEHIGKFTLTEDGSYLVAVEYTDKSGNKMDSYSSPKMILDNTKPILDATYSKASYPERDDVIYFNSNIDVNLKVTEINFFKEAVKVTVTKDDKPYDVKVNWTDVENSNEHIGTFTLTEDGSYLVAVEYTDKSGNKMESYSSPKMIHDKTPPVVRVIYSDNTPVNTLKDSGDNDRQYFDDTQVATITITERNFNGADITIASKDVSGNDVKDTYTETGWVRVDDNSDDYVNTITYNGDANYTFDIRCTDLATNESEKYQTDYFTVDKTAPENLTIAYSKSVLDTVLETISFGFYQAKSKVTITADDDTSPINEFVYSYTKASGVSRVNAELLNQTVSEAKITYSDDNKTATATFTATFSIPKGILTNNTQFNGTVGFTAKDRAGNDTDKKDKKRIVVDNIVPVCEVTYNQHVNEDGGVYYFDGNINASVKITEANFYSGDVVVSVTKDGASYPVSPRWTDESVDVHIGTFTLSQDGDYEITVSYTDKSGNAMTTYESNQLTIDTQIEEPTYSINGVAKTNEGGAYKKNATVAFSFSDENYNTNTIKLTRTRFNKVEDVTSKFVKAALNANGGSGSFSIPTTVENDGIYVLSIGMTDKALHSTQSQMKFTINRYGSVYEYDDNLTALIKDGGQYVTSVQDDLVITEYNAERILKDSLNILITRDGEAIDVDYTSTPEKIDSKVKIGSSGWYQYVYTIKASNFAKDGVYKISVSSAYAATDSDKNESSSVPENSIDNEGNQILDSMSFVVDSTAPEIRNVVNLDEAIVNAQSLDVKYTIVDVGGLKCVEVIVNGEVVDTITEFGESAFNYSGQFKINEQTGAQTVQLRVTDLAGNVTDTAAENFSTGGMYVFNDTITVSTNFFVRWYASKLLFWGSIAGVIILVAAVWFIISKRKKN